MAHSNKELSLLAQSAKDLEGGISMNKLCKISEKNELRFFELNDEITFIGRSAVNDVRIRDNYVSREHLMLRKLRNRVLVRDLGSKNGTFVNGIPLRPGAEVEVRKGASIVIGTSVIRLRDEGSDKVLALISSIHPPNEHGSTDRLVSRKSVQPVKHQPNDLTPALPGSTLHAFNIQFSKGS